MTGFDWSVPRHLADLDWDICFLTDSTSSNSLGRVYCLWLLAERLGYRSVVVSGDGDDIWGPLAGTRFSEVVLPPESALRSSWRRVVARSRVVVCVKPLPWQLACARELVLGGFRGIIFDVDEPDIEAGLSLNSPLKHAAKRILRPRVTELFNWARRFVPKSGAVTVSNPWLQERYGGTVLPHVREDLGDSRSEPEAGVDVAFVGTNRGHKGLAMLRIAVAALHEQYGMRLTITDQRPPDAAIWENWVGKTSLDEGLAIVRRANIVAIPSLPTAFSMGQLPVKLIDAMMLGKMIIGSDLPPIRWALAESGLLFEPGSLSDLERCLISGCNSAERERRGIMARSRFTTRFSIEANVDIFRSIVESQAGEDI